MVKKINLKISRKLFLSGFRNFDYYEPSFDNLGFEPIFPNTEENGILPEDNNY